MCDDYTIHIIQHEQNNQSGPLTFKLNLLLVVSSRYLSYNMVHFFGNPQGPSLSFSFFAAPLAFASFFAVPAAAVVVLLVAAAAPSLFPPLPCSQPEALDTVS